MKVHSIIILFLFLQLLLCDELGGIKVVLNDEFIKSTLANFEDKIKVFLEGVKLEDQKPLTNMVFGVKNFTLDKINLSFGEDGLINVKVKNLEPFLIGQISIKIISAIVKKFTIRLTNFSLEGKVRVKSKQLSNGGYTPDAEFVSDPKLYFNIKFEIGGSLGSIVEKALNSAVDIIQKIILKVVSMEFNDLLAIIMKSLPTEAKIGLYWMDFTLSSPIQLKNKFLEINSYGLLYSKDYPETSKKDRYTLAKLPSSTNNKFQLLVSEYSINSAAYTYLTANKLNNILKYNIITSFVNVMLPDISKKYGSKNAELSFNPKPESNVKLTEDYLYLELPGTFYVKIDGVDVFICELYLKLKAQATIEIGPKMSAKIMDITGNIGDILLNDATTASKDKIDSGFILIRNALKPIMNEYIKQYANLSFPSIMGISFTNVEIHHKDGYLLVNLDISK